MVSFPLSDVDFIHTYLSYSIHGIFKFGTLFPRDFNGCTWFYHIEGISFEDPVLASETVKLSELTLMCLLLQTDIC